MKSVPRMHGIWDRGKESMDFFIEIIYHMLARFRQVTRSQWKRVEDFDGIKVSLSQRQVCWQCHSSSKMEQKDAV
jgi:hypothetical protein